MPSLVKILLLAGAVSVGCKPLPKGASADGVNMPARVGGGPGDATAAVKIGVLGKGGGSHLTVDLGRLPSASSSNLWTCWHVPADSFGLGRAVCAAQPDKNVEIVAANVDFTCASDPQFGAVKAKTPLAMTGCETFDIFAYQFDPPLTLKVDN
jgi:hypothetical protein